jgi:3-hydroxybutyryl-CoA dehydratase|tara:strand:- start:94 stop:537 length:444 start_codon:yes stop_codon:yes gene_type:complete
MEEFYFSVGDNQLFSKTIGEFDIYAFAGITGDFSPNHVNEIFMKQTHYGGRIAHGVLLIGFMSTASTLLVEKKRNNEWSESPVSKGYNKIRFLEGVCIGDTISVSYTVKSIELDKRQTLADVKITNQNGNLVAIAEHIMKWVKIKND